MLFFIIILIYPRVGRVAGTRERFDGWWQTAAALGLVHVIKQCLVNNCRSRCVVAAAHAHRVSINKIMFFVCYSRVQVGKTKTRSPPPPTFPKVAWPNKKKIITPLGTRPVARTHERKRRSRPGDNNDIGTTTTTERSGSPTCRPAATVRALFQSNNARPLAPLRQRRFLYIYILFIVYYYCCQGCVRTGTFFLPENLYPKPSSALFRLHSLPIQRRIQSPTDGPS